jgi:hypothetical protein
MVRGTRTSGVGEVRHHACQLKQDNKRVDSSCGSKLIAAKLSEQRAMEATAEQTTNSDRTSLATFKMPPQHIRWSQIAGFAVFGVILFSILWESTDGHPTAFYTSTGVVLVLACTGTLLLATFGGSGVRQAIKVLFAAVTTTDEHRTAISFFQLGAVYALASGLIGLFIGMVAMFRNMGGDTSAIGKALAVAVLTPFYGAILAVVFLVLAGSISRRELTSGTLETLARRALPISVGVAVVGTLACLLLPSIIFWH